MASAEKKRILVADSDLLSLATTIGALKDNYLVVPAKSGADLFTSLEKNQIDMIILETRLSDMDGFEICRRLKAEPLSRDLPVIFITAQNRGTAEEKGFAAGAVEYITKPLNVPTVKARIKNQFALCSAIKELQRLNRLALDANPNTGLPGNPSILSELQRLVEDGDAVCVVYADLDNFKVYNDTYGFARGDDVIRFTANVIRVALQLHDCGECFLGHIGGDDFVFIVPAKKQVLVAAEIVRRMEQGIGEFYSAEDLERNYVVASDREGQCRQHPLVCLSMGAIDLTRHRVATAFEIIDICTETKSMAKKRPGSNIIVDQRRSG